MPKISVIIPIYNVSEWLDRCLESVAGHLMISLRMKDINSCRLILSNWIHYFILKVLS